MKPYIVQFEKLKNSDVELVGGKNASIGEMISSLAALGVSVPGGFATTAHAYRDFLAQDGLDERIREILATLDVDDIDRLSAVGARDPRLDARDAVPQAAAGRVARHLAPHGRRPAFRRRRALVRDGRGSAGGFVRGPAGDVFERARRGASAEVRTRGVRLAVQRSRDRLSRAQPVRSRGGGAVGRRAAHGAQRPRRQRA